MLPQPDSALSRAQVTLRPWADQDEHCVAEASTDPRIVESTTVPSPYTPDAGRVFIERQIARTSEGKLSLAIDVNGSAVGLIFANPREIAGVVGLGYWVIPSRRRERIASTAAELLSDWLLELPNVARVEAWVEPANEGSARVLHRAGFEREGHLRDYFPLADRRASVDVYSRVRG